MNFNLDSEQQMLQDSVRRFVVRDYSFEARNAALAAGWTCSELHWRTFADNGWLAAAVPEALGGLGGTLIETVLIAQEFGRALVVEPYMGCAVLGVQTIVAAGTPTQCENLLPPAADGTRRIALAHGEAQARGMAAPVHTRAERSGEGYRLFGNKTLVPGGADAHTLIVSAVTPDADGLTLFVVDANTPELTRHVLPLHDGSRAAELTFDGVAATRAAVLGEPGRGLPAVQHALAHGTATLCAELVGGMEQAIAMTADYLKVRTQFGVPLGSFQALQHRLADMAAELEVARSMLYALLASIANDPAEQRDYVVSQAASLTSAAAKHVCGEAIQLHGGIGMTEEYQVGHYYKRAIVADALLGGGDRHDARCAQYLQRTLVHGDTRK
ncbi:acyl-CoA dehydrogenase family protein [Paraburkholderia rhynchosiae]|uniref:Acryloyl-CoA reductase (NADH) n=1 Tax=Paraburkholderia rhynchosiae TaxID=487049 RepID=A0A2N7W598_9BURK|nr:acyl-CoA dehydrogenase family protein [Paraburkholderia rhynchosiae]PMS24562.1 acyl-CoA dehydrogenase [Paraburkholderia rhynchosiae]CAB3735190.1 Acryloyl-CoA reductase (NADH) [Paraburkholderia rhynchosiae]